MDTWRSEVRISCLPVSHSLHLFLFLLDMVPPPSMCSSLIGYTDCPMTFRDLPVSIPPNPGARVTQVSYALLLLLARLPGIQSHACPWLVSARPTESSPQPDSSLFKMISNKPEEKCSTQAAVFTSSSSGHARLTLCSAASL